MHGGLKVKVRWAKEARFSSQVERACLWNVKDRECSAQPEVTSSGRVLMDGMPLAMEGKCCIMPLGAWDAVWVGDTGLGIMNEQVGLGGNRDENYLFSETMHHICVSCPC